jgi:glyoxylase-like metal-dependent hydrolase (beta-lactamase superfamily II)
MRVGPYSVSVHEHFGFRLDGGAMFGSVPKAIWERLCPPDDRNRIPMAARSLIIEDGNGKKLMVDAGCGSHWPAKFREIFAIPDAPYEPATEVTDLLLTHLHFDHAGGVVRATGPSSDTPEPSYPSALHHVSEANLANARSPNPRERASYLPEIVAVLETVPLHLTGPGDEVWPGLILHRADGHTRGLQWITLTGDRLTLAFPSDLFPTGHHLPAHFTMGYDMCAEVGMREKMEFLERAIDEDWIVVFQHDPDLPAARLKWDDRGRPAVAERVEL